MKIETDCEYCGTHYRHTLADGAVCPGCGAISREMSEQAQEITQKRLGCGLRIAVLLLILFVLCVAGVVLMTLQGNWSW